MSVDTLSTANNKSDTIVPTDSKDQIISDESNPAYLAGALHEAKEFYERTGHFENLIKYRAVLHNNKITVASEVSAYFVSGQITSPKSYTFDDPCESDPDRVTAYDVGKTVGTNDFGTKTAGMTVPDNIYINRLALVQEDRNFANSLLSIIGDRKMRERLRKDCGNSGLALIPLIKAEEAKVKPNEKTLAATEFGNYANAPYVGELSLSGFDAWYEQYVTRSCYAAFPPLLELPPRTPSAPSTPSSSATPTTVICTR